MAIAEQPVSDSEVAILGRLFLNGKRRLTQQQARYLLELEFSAEDQERMNQLAQRNQEGRLSGPEHEELLGYAKAGCLLGIFHSRARRALAKSSARRRS